MFDLDEKIFTHSVKLVKEKIYKDLKERLHCDGLTLAQNNEYGQEIKHYHIHLIPRYENDNADFNYDKTKISDLDEVFEKLTK